MMTIIREFSPQHRPLSGALAVLERELTGRGLDSDPAISEWIVGIPGAGTVGEAILREWGLSLSPEPESLLIHRNKSRVLLAGSDERGLRYAILEAAEAIRLGGLDGLMNVRETPHLAVRSLSVKLFNTDVEREWFESESFWSEFFLTLARNRYNQFILTFGSQTNYRSPLFPWLFSDPEEPELGVEEWTAADQAKLLHTFRRITDLAVDHGLDFHLGMWTLIPHEPEKSYGPNRVRNFPPAERQPGYFARNFARLLAECPAISGVQFRLNYECGVPPEKQTEFFDPIFAALGFAGRRITAGLRWKGLHDSTIQNAQQAGLDVVVSTKFWCEQLGLPFHPTDEDPLYARDRYGFGPLLNHSRSYRVNYQLWNEGSNRFLLWGDPVYAARFAESCAEGGGEGFEVAAPLGNKGFGDAPGNWQIFADRSYDANRWEIQRYWMQLLVFGRLGYNPQASPEIWRREFRNRFGPAASALETAYVQASQILPLITVVRQDSASEWRFWPEMSTGYSLELYGFTPPSDRAQFYPIRRWENAPGWSGDSWTADQSGFVEDAVAGKLQGKWSPIRMSQWLGQLANDTRAALAAAGSSDSAEFRATQLDFRVLAQLADYHACKTRAATHLEFFRQTQETGRLVMVLAEIEQAAEAWRALVDLTDGVYHSDLVFGHIRWTNSYRVHAGHWKNKLPEVLADVTWVKKIIEESGPLTPGFRSYPGETLTGFPTIRHTPIRRLTPGAGLSIRAEVTSSIPIREVSLHYRAMDQTRGWNQVRMVAAPSAPHYAAEVPRAVIDSQFDLQYYLEVCTAEGGGLWPDWRETTPYVVVRTGERQGLGGIE